MTVCSVLWTLVPRWSGISSNWMTGARREGDSSQKERTDRRLLGKGLQPLTKDMVSLEADRALLPTRRRRQKRRRSQRRRMGKKRYWRDLTPKMGLTGSAVTHNFNNSHYMRPLY